MLDELKNSLSKLKTKFCKLESDLHISRNVNDKLSYKRIVLKQKCHAVKMNSTPKENALKSRAFLLEWGIKTLKKRFWRLWMQSRPLFTRICQGKPSKASAKEVILKLSCRKVSCRYC